MGLCLIKQNKINKGINCYKSAIQIKPDFAEAHNNLGIAYKNIGMINEAIESYHSAIKLKSNFAEAYNNLGLIMMDQDKIEEAIMDPRSFEKGRRPMATSIFLSKPMNLRFLLVKFFFAALKPT